MNSNRHIVIATALLIIGALFLAVPVAVAQPPGNTEIRLGYVTPVVDVDQIKAGITVSFPMIFLNRDTTRYNVKAGFVIYADDDGIPSSPQGTGTATWSFATANGGNYKFSPTPVKGIWLDTTGFYAHADFGGGFDFACLSCDGQGADTLVFTATTSDPSQRGAHATDSGVLFTVKILTRLSDTCKFICIDTVAAVSGEDTWKWGSVNYTPEYTAVPTWSGAHCYKVYTKTNCLICRPSACCTGLTGNVDCDPENRVDISDLTRLIDYEYVSFSPLCCAQAANIDGDDWGGVDISDVSRLINYLYIDFTWPAPCPFVNPGCM